MQADGAGKDDSWARLRVCQDSTGASLESSEGSSWAGNWTPAAREGESSDEAGREGERKSQSSDGRRGATEEEERRTKRGREEEREVLSGEDFK